MAYPSVSFFVVSTKAAKLPTCSAALALASSPISVWAEIGAPGDETAHTTVNGHNGAIVCLVVSKLAATHLLLLVSGHGAQHSKASQLLLV